MKMSKPKSIGFVIRNCMEPTVIGNKSFGSDIGFQVTGSPGAKISDNIHYSTEALKNIIEAEKAISESSDEIKQMLGDDKLDEIISIMNDIKRGTKDTPAKIMERLVAAGANALTIWPHFLNLIHSLTT